MRRFGGVQAFRIALRTSLGVGSAMAKREEKFLPTRPAIVKTSLHALVHVADARCVEEDMMRTEVLPEAILALERTSTTLRPTDVQSRRRTLRLGARLTEAVTTEIFEAPMMNVPAREWVVTVHVVRRAAMRSIKGGTILTTRTTSRTPFVVVIMVLETSGQTKVTPRVLTKI